MKKVLMTLISLLILTSIIVGVGIVMADTKATTATVSVNEWLSVTLSNVPIQFPSMNPGTISNATVGSGFPLNATIGSESNVNANVSTKADGANFTSGSKTFAVGNMSWSATEGGAYIAYSITDAKVCAGVSPGGTCNAYHRLTVPSAQAAGNYSVGVTVTATKAA